MKNRLVSAFFAPLVIFAALSLPASAKSVKEVNAQIDNVLGDHEGFAGAFKVLQANIADGARMAMEYTYPMTVVVDGKDVVFATQDDFVAGYNAIVTPAVVAVVRKQDYKNVTVTSKGIMFGSGQLWVNAYCLDGEACEDVSWDISAINH